MSRIHLTLSVDDRLWAPAYAAMRAVCLSTRRKRDLTFHVLHRPLSAEHFRTLKHITTEFGAALALYDLDADSVFGWVTEKAPAHAGIADLGYARLLLGELLPRDLGQVVALDCDMLVRAPVERIAELDLLDHAAAAAPLADAKASMTGRMLIDPRGIFDAGGRYFDAGLMVIDLERWRELKLVEKFETLLDDGRLAQLRNAGEFLNLAVADEWLELDQLWSLLDPRRELEPLNAFAVHYAGQRKPWQVGSRAAYARVYRHTMTNDVYYRFLAERLPAWLRPLVAWLGRPNG